MVWQLGQRWMASLQLEMQHGMRQQPSQHPTKQSPPQRIQLSKPASVSTVVNTLAWQLGQVTCWGYGPKLRTLTTTVCWFGGGFIGWLGDEFIGYGDGYKPCWGGCMGRAWTEICWGPDEYGIGICKWCSVCIGALGIPYGGGGSAKFPFSLDMMTMTVVVRLVHSPSN